jgi:ZIP family zinc transporter
MIAAMAALLGSLIAIFPFKPSERTVDIMLGFTSGVMLALIFFELLKTSIEKVGLEAASIAFIAGSVTLLLVDRYLPHLHARFLKGSVIESELIGTGLLISIAMAIHNLCEGLAVGVGYLTLPSLGLLIAIAIAIHNIPEGLSSAAPLYAGGMTRSTTMLIAIMSSLTEPLAAILSAICLPTSLFVLGLSLAFAGGAMLYITGDELIPESHSHGYEHEATLAMLAGLLFTLFLSRLLKP